MDQFLVMMLSGVIIYGISTVVFTLLDWLPFEGLEWEIIKPALMFAVMCITFAHCKVVEFTSMPLGEGFWKRVRKNLLKEMSSVKWTLAAAPIALVVGVGFVFIFVSFLETVTITVGPCLKLVCTLFTTYILMETNFRVARLVISAYENKPQTSKGD